MSTTITFSRYGEPDVLTVSAAEVPRPGPGQVRIRVHAVAVNPIDAKIRSGHMDGIFPISLPMTPGWDVAGVVDAAGPAPAQPRATRSSASPRSAATANTRCSTGRWPGRRGFPRRPRPRWSRSARRRTEGLTTWASRQGRRC